MVVTQHSYFAKFITQVLAIIYLCIFSTLANASTPFCFVRSHVAINYPSPIEACNAEIALFNQYSASFVRLPQYLSCGSNCGVVGSCFTTYVTLNNTIQANSEMSAVCVCQIAGEVLSNIDFTCAPPGGQLSLTSVPQTPPDPRPKGTEGKEPKSSTHELIATVTENGSPKAGVAVTFKVEVKEGSGEHGVTGGAVHDHRFRVKDHSGKVPPSGMTKANGEVSIKFEAPILAGTHTITATCETCSNKTATKDVKVLVPDLVDLPSDTKKPKTFELVGADSSTGKNHPDNHYFTTAARDTLVNGVIPRLYKNGWGVVGVNDGSLKDGGLFDLEGKWVTSGGHAEHRKGTEVDIRTRDNSPKMVQDGYDALCDKEQAALGIQTLWHKKDGYGAHFHIYLSGIGLRADAIGGCCTSVIGPKKNKDGTPLLDKQGNPIKGAICE